MKGFYVLNVQCIIDDHKKVLWVSYSHTGGAQDSSYFRDTDLYKTLLGIREELYKLDYYILGNSVYAIELFFYHHMMVIIHKVQKMTLAFINLVPE